MDQLVDSEVHVPVGRVDRCAPRAPEEESTIHTIYTALIQIMWGDEKQRDKEREKSEIRWEKNFK